MDTMLVARSGMGSPLPLRRRSCAQRPTLDVEVAPDELPSSYSPREYIGIALNAAAADFTYVTVTYSGTGHGANATVDRSVIFGQTLRVTNP